ncbi:uncharacterized protein [Linepithema humile]|uniref:uncharacterized protein n=1 Tax=Linepithema humile TaxID=83485 RepID=UPI00351F150E
MPKTCIIPNCLKKCKKSVFKVPHDAKCRETWILAILNQFPNLQLPQIFYVCENHFKEDDILTKKIITSNDGTIIFERDFSKKILTKNASPYFSLSTIIENNVTDKSNEIVMDDNKNIKNLEENISEEQEQIINESLLTQPTSPSISISKEEDNYLIEKQKVFQEILHGKKNISLPEVSWGFHRIFKFPPLLIFSYADRFVTQNCVISKQIIIHDDLQYNVYFLGQEALSNQHILEDIDDINLLLEHANSIVLCQGGPSILCFENIQPLCAKKDLITNTWRHNKCLLQTNGEKICKFCVSLHSTLQRNVDRNKFKNSEKKVLTPTTRKKVAALRAAKRVKTQILQRWKLNQKAMKNTIKCLQLKMN